MAGGVTSWIEPLGSIPGIVKQKRCSIRGFIPNLRKLNEGISCKNAVWGQGSVLEIELEAFYP